MKKFAGTGIVVVIFAALLAYLLVAKPKDSEGRKQDALTLTSSKRETIDRIAIRTSAGEITLARVVPEPEVWRITSPGPFIPEDSALSQMKNALSDLVAVDPVWPAPTEEQRKQVALDLPATSVKWHAADGDHTLSLGKPFPKRDEVYVQVTGSPGIFLVRKFAVEVFTKGINDLRRHKIFDFDRDAVRTITVTTKEGKLRATRADTLAPWIASGPFSGRADRGKMNNVLAKLYGLRADAFVDAANPKALAKPRVMVETTGHGAVTLVVGDEADGGKWIGKDPASGQIFIASTNLPTDLVAPFAEWRDRTLLDFPVEDVSTLELTIGGATYGFHRDDSKMFVSNGGTSVNAEAAQFLRAVKTATVSERSEKGSFGFEKPALSASWLLGSGEKRQQITLAVGAPKGKAHWVKTSEMPGGQLVADDLVATANALATASKAAVVTSAGQPVKSGG